MSVGDIGPSPISEYSCQSLHHPAPEPFPLWQVELAEGSECASAQAAGERYLLALDPDRLLQPMRRECGIAPDGLVADPYPNWESMGMGGHMCGHYLSGLSGFWRASRRQVLLDRTTYMVDTLAQCQQRLGSGYVGGIPDSHSLFAALRSGQVDAQSFELNGSWVPLYNLHKLIAGLIDVYEAFGDASGLPDSMVQPSSEVSCQALVVVEALADWWCSLSDGLADDDFEHMLGCEYGGMNEVFAHLYSISCKERYLHEAIRFTDRSLYGPLSKGEDALTGLHANTQIPKVLGYERLAALTGDRGYETAVNTFWHSVVDHRSVSIGAHSVGEYFHATDNFEELILSRQGVETCNSYNMAKLAERLYSHSGQAQYLDFYERVTQNHLLSTINQEQPEGLVYFTPMRPRHYRVYSSAQECFWCCVGSGLESHSRYGRLIYARNPDLGPEHVYINLFTPSTLHWQEQGLTLSQSTDPMNWNTDIGRLEISADDGRPRNLHIHIRRPWWCAQVTYEFINGSGFIEHASSCDQVVYDGLNICWSGSMSIRIVRTLKLNIEGLPDESAWGSVLRGFKVLALPDGTDDMDGLIADSTRAAHIPSGPMRPLGDLPLLCGSGDECIVPHERADGSLDVKVRCRHSPKSAGSSVLTMVPFSSLGPSRYSLYLPWVSDHHGDPEPIWAHLDELDAKEAGDELRICDVVRCGEQQSEVDHEYHGVLDKQAYIKGRHCRRAAGRGFFSYRLKDWERLARNVIVRSLTYAEDLRTTASTLPDYRLVIEDGRIDVGTRVRYQDDDGLLVDRYEITQGALGLGDDMTGSVRVESVNGAGTPGIVSIALMK